MPMLFIEAPQGIQSDAKKTMMEKINVAMEDAFHFGDVRVFLREYSADNVSQDGHMHKEPVRPVCFMETPQLANISAKRKLVEEINTAVAEAYEGLANTTEIMVLHNEYPLENAGWAGRLQSDDPEVVEAVKQLKQRG